MASRSPATPRRTSPLATLFSAGMFLLVATSSHADIAVIVHKDNPVTALTTDQIQRIFLGKIGTFPDGRRATPLDSPRGPARDRFYAKTANKTAEQMKAYWARLMFTGGTVMPRVMDNDAAVVLAVGQDTTAIGYVTAPVNDPGVKTVLTVPR